MVGNFRVFVVKPAVLSDLVQEDQTKDRAGRPDGARTTGAALEAHYRFLLWLVPTVDRFPRKQKFLLGDRIQETAPGNL